MYCRNRPNVISNDLKCPGPLIVSGFAPKALAPRPLRRLKADPPSFLGTNLTLQIGYTFPDMHMWQHSNVLHWLPLQQRIMFRIGAMVWRCILGLAPAYLRDLCHPTPGTRGCSSLRSSEQGLLFVPF